MKTSHFEGSIALSAVETAQWFGRVGAGGGQAEASAFVSDGLESFAEGIQRSGLVADDRELHPVLGKCVSIFWRTKRVTQARMPKAKPPPELRSSAGFISSAFRA